MHGKLKERIFAGLTGAAVAVSLTLAVISAAKTPKVLVEGITLESVSYNGIDSYRADIAVSVTDVNYAYGLGVGLQYNSKYMRLSDWETNTPVPDDYTPTAGTCPIYFKTENTLCGNDPVDPSKPYDPFAWTQSNKFESTVSSDGYQRVYLQAVFDTPKLQSYAAGLGKTGWDSDWSIQPINAAIYATNTKTDSRCIFGHLSFWVDPENLSEMVRYFDNTNGKNEDLGKMLIQLDTPTEDQSYYIQTQVYNNRTRRWVPTPVDTKEHVQIDIAFYDTLLGAKSVPDTVYVNAYDAYVIGDIADIARTMQKYAETVRCEYMIVDRVAKTSSTEYRDISMLWGEAWPPSPAGAWLNDAVIPTGAHCGMTIAPRSGGGPVYRLTWTNVATGAYLLEEETSPGSGTFTTVADPSSAVYDPRGGEYSISQYYLYDELNGITGKLQHKVFTTPMNVKLYVTPVTLVDIEADDLTRTYRNTKDEVPLSKSGLSLPTEARLTISPALGGVVPTQPLTWLPKAIADLAQVSPTPGEKWPAAADLLPGDVYPAVKEGEYTLSSTVKRADVVKDTPWLTITEALFPVGMGTAAAERPLTAQRNIVGSGATGLAGDYRMWAYPTDATGEITFIVGKVARNMAGELEVDATGRALKYERMTSPTFTFYMPGGDAVIAPGGEIVPSWFSAATMSSYTPPPASPSASAKDPDGNGVTDGYFYYTTVLPGDAGGSYKDARELLRRYINKGGYFGCTVQEGSGSVSDRITAYSRPRQNVYIKSYTLDKAAGDNIPAPNPDHLAYLFDYSGDRRGLLPYYGGSLPRLLTLAADDRAAVRYDPATGAEPGGLRQAAVDDWLSSATNPASPAPGEEYTLTLGADTFANTYSYGGKRVNNPLSPAQLAANGKAVNDPLVYLPDKNPDVYDRKLKVRLTAQGTKIDVTERLVLTYETPNKPDKVDLHSDNQVKRVIFDKATEGYTSQQIVTLTLRNTSVDSKGNGVEVKGIYIETKKDSRFRILSAPAVNLPAGGVTTFTVSYEPNLPEGTYIDEDVPGNSAITIYTARSGATAVKRFEAELSVAKNTVHTVTVVVLPDIAAEGGRYMGDAALVTGGGENGVYADYNPAPAPAVYAEGDFFRILTTPKDEYSLICEGGHRRVYYYTDDDPTGGSKVYLDAAPAVNPDFLGAYTKTGASTGGAVTPGILPTLGEGETLFLAKMPGYSVTVYVEYFEPLYSKLRIDCLIPFAGPKETAPASQGGSDDLYKVKTPAAVPGDLPVYEYEKELRVRSTYEPTVYRYPKQDAYLVLLTNTKTAGDYDEMYCGVQVDLYTILKKINAVGSTKNPPEEWNQNVTVSVTMKLDDAGTVNLANPEKGATVYSGSTPSRHRSTPFIGPEAGESKTLTITLSAKAADAVTGTAFDHPEETPATAQRVYTVTFARVPTEAKHALRAGNSPWGMIENDDSITDKAAARAVFDNADSATGKEANRFEMRSGEPNYVYTPKAVRDGNLKNIYWPEAWEYEAVSGENLDRSLSALFVYLGEDFEDPGADGVCNGAGDLISVYSALNEPAHTKGSPLTVERSIRECNLMSTNEIEGYDGTAGRFVPAAVGQTIPLASYTVTSPGVIGKITSTELRTHTDVRPGIYEITYAFDDPSLSGTRLSFTRPLIVLSARGDVNADCAVNAQDAGQIRSRFPSNFPTYTPGYSPKDILVYRFRIADVNNDRNLNNVDANEITRTMKETAAGAELRTVRPPFYLPTGYTNKTKAAKVVRNASRSIALAESLLPGAGSPFGEETSAQPEIVERVPARERYLPTMAKAVPGAGAETIRVPAAAGKTMPSALHFIQPLTKGRLYAAQVTYGDDTEALKAIRKKYNVMFAMNYGEDYDLDETIASVGAYYNNGYDFTTRTNAGVRGLYAPEWRGGGVPSPRDLYGMLYVLGNFDDSEEEILQGGNLCYFDKYDDDDVLYEFWDVDPADHSVRIKESVTEDLIGRVRLPDKEFDSWKIYEGVLHNSTDTYAYDGSSLEGPGYNTFGRDVPQQFIDLTDSLLGREEGHHYWDELYDPARDSSDYTGQSMEELIEHMEGFSTKNSESDFLDYLANFGDNRRYCLSLIATWKPSGNATLTKIDVKSPAGTSVYAYTAGMEKETADELAAEAPLTDGTGHSLAGENAATSTYDPATRSWSYDDVTLFVRVPADVNDITLSLDAFEPGSLVFDDTNATVDLTWRDIDPATVYQPPAAPAAFAHPTNSTANPARHSFEAKISDLPFSDGEAGEYTSDITFKVKAPDGTEKKYIVKIQRLRRPSYEYNPGNTAAGMKERMKLGFTDLANGGNFEDDAHYTVFSAGNNIEADMATLAVYEGSTFEDPGYTIVDAIGERHPSNPRFSTDPAQALTDRNADLLFSRPAGDAARPSWSITFTETSGELTPALLATGSIGGTSDYTADSAGSGNEVNARAISLRGRNIVPGVYQLRYLYEDPYEFANGKTVPLHNTRNVMVVFLRGDADMDGCVTPADGALLRTLLADGTVAALSASADPNPADHGQGNMAAKLYLHRTLQVNAGSGAGYDALPGETDAALLEAGFDPITAGSRGGKRKMLSSDGTGIYDNPISSYAYYLPLPDNGDLGTKQREDSTGRGSGKIGLTYIGQGSTLSSAVKKPLVYTNGAVTGNVFWVGITAENLPAEMTGSIENITLSLGYDSRYVEPYVPATSDWLSYVRGQNSAWAGYSFLPYSNAYLGIDARADAAEPLAPGQRKASSRTELYKEKASELCKGMTGTEEDAGDHYREARISLSRRSGTPLSLAAFSDGTIATDGVVLKVAFRMKTAAADLPVPADYAWITPVFGPRETTLTLQNGTGVCPMTWNNQRIFGMTSLHRNLADYAAPGTIEKMPYGSRQMDPWLLQTTDGADTLYGFTALTAPQGYTHTVVRNGTTDTIPTTVPGVISIEWVSDDPDHCLDGATRGNKKYPTLTFNQSNPVTAFSLSGPIPEAGDYDFVLRGTGYASDRLRLHVEKAPLVLTPQKTEKYYGESNGNTTKQYFLFDKSCIAPMDYADYPAGGWSTLGDTDATGDALAALFTARACAYTAPNLELVEAYSDAGVSFTKTAATAGTVPGDSYRLLLSGGGTENYTFVYRDLLSDGTAGGEHDTYSTAPYIVWRRPLLIANIVPDASRLISVGSGVYLRDDLKTTDPLRESTERVAVSGGAMKEINIADSMLPYMLSAFDYDGSTSAAAGQGLYLVNTDKKGQIYPEFGAATGIVAPVNTAAYALERAALLAGAVPSEPLPFTPSVGRVGSDTLTVNYRLTVRLDKSKDDLTSGRATIAPGSTEERSAGADNLCLDPSQGDNARYYLVNAFTTDNDTENFSGSLKQLGRALPVSGSTRPTCGRVLITAGSTQGLTFKGDPARADWQYGEIWDGDTQLLAVEITDSDNRKFTLQNIKSYNENSLDLYWVDETQTDDGKGGTVRVDPRDPKFSYLCDKISPSTTVLEPKMTVWKSDKNQTGRYLCLVDRTMGSSVEPIYTTVRLTVHKIDVLLTCTAEEFIYGEPKDISAGSIEHLVLSYDLNAILKGDRRDFMRGQDLIAETMRPGFSLDGQTNRSVKPEDYAKIQRRRVKGIHEVGGSADPDGVGSSSAVGDYYVNFSVADTPHYHFVYQTVEKDGSTGQREDYGYVPGVIHPRLIMVNGFNTAGVDSPRMPYDSPTLTGTAKGSLHEDGITFELQHYSAPETNIHYFYRDAADTVQEAYYNYGTIGSAVGYPVLSRDTVPITFDVRFTAESGGVSGNYWPSIHSAPGGEVRADVRVSHVRITGAVAAGNYIVGYKSYNEAANGFLVTGGGIVGEHMGRKAQILSGPTHKEGYSYGDEFDPTGILMEITFTDTTKPVRVQLSDYYTVNDTFRKEGYSLVWCTSPGVPETASGGGMREVKPGDVFTKAGDAYFAVVYGDGTVADDPAGYLTIPVAKKPLTLQLRDVSSFYGETPTLPANIDFTRRLFADDSYSGAGFVAKLAQRDQATLTTLDRLLQDSGYTPSGMTYRSPDNVLVEPVFTYRGGAVPKNLAVGTYAGSVGCRPITLKNYDVTILSGSLTVQQRVIYLEGVVSSPTKPFAFIYAGTNELSAVRTLVCESPASSPKANFAVTKPGSASPSSLTGSAIVSGDKLEFTLTVRFTDNTLPSGQMEADTKAFIENFALTDNPDCANANYRVLTEAGGVPYTVKDVYGKIYKRTIDSVRFYDVPRVDYVYNSNPGESAGKLDLSRLVLEMTLSTSNQEALTLRPRQSFTDRAGDLTAEMHVFYWNKNDRVPLGAGGGVDLAALQANYTEAKQGDILSRASVFAAGHIAAHGKSLLVCVITRGDTDWETNGKYLIVPGTISVARRALSYSVDPLIKTYDGFTAADNAVTGGEVQLANVCTDAAGYTDDVRVMSQRLELGQAGVAWGRGSDGVFENLLDTIPVYVREVSVGGADAGNYIIEPGLAVGTARVDRTDRTRDKVNLFRRDMRMTLTVSEKTNAITITPSILSDEDYYDLSEERRTGLHKVSEYAEFIPGADENRDAGEVRVEYALAQLNEDGTLARDAAGDPILTPWQTSSVFTNLKRGTYYSARARLAATADYNASDYVTSPGQAGYASAADAIAEESAERAALAAAKYESDVKSRYPERGEGGAVARTYTYAAEIMVLGNAAVRDALRFTDREEMENADALTRLFDALENEIYKPPYYWDDTALDSVLFPLHLGEAHTADLEQKDENGNVTQIHISYDPATDFAARLFVQVDRKSGSTWVPEKEIVRELVIQGGDIIARVGDAPRQLSCAIVPAQGGNFHTSWRSSNGDICSVTSGGLVRFLKEGSCTLTAVMEDLNDENIRYTASVRVTVLAQNAPREAEGEATDAAAEEFFAHSYFDWESTEPLMELRSDGSFDEKGTVTRGEAMLILSRVFKVPYGARPMLTVSYLDVRRNSPYYDAVNLLSRWQMVRGVGAGYFAPERPVTRGETAVILSRILNLSLATETDGLSPHYPDVTPESCWAWRQIETLTAWGIMGDTGYGFFEPEREITRGETATILVRLLKDKTFRKTNSIPFDLTENSWCFDAAMRVIYGTGEAQSERLGMKTQPGLRAHVPGESTLPDVRWQEDVQGQIEREEPERNGFVPQAGLRRRITSSAEEVPLPESTLTPSAGESAPTTEAAPQESSPAPKTAEPEPTEEPTDGSPTETAEPVPEPTEGGRTPSGPDEYIEPVDRVY